MSSPTAIAGRSVQSGTVGESGVAAQDPIQLGQGIQARLRTAPASVIGPSLQAMMQNYVGLAQGVSNIEDARFRIERHFGFDRRTPTEAT